MTRMPFGPALVMTGLALLLPGCSSDFYTTLQVQIGAAETAAAPVVVGHNCYAVVYAPGGVLGVSPVLASGSVLLSAATDYNLLMSLPLLMILLFHFRDFSRWGQAVLVIDLFIVFVTFYDLIGPAQYDAFMAGSVTTLNFLLLVGFGFWLRLRHFA